MPPLATVPGTFSKTYAEKSSCCEQQKIHSFDTEANTSCLLSAEPHSVACIQPLPEHESAASPLITNPSQLRMSDGEAEISYDVECSRETLSFHVDSKPEIESLSMKLEKLDPNVSTMFAQSKEDNPHKGVQFFFVCAA